MKVNIKVKDKKEKLNTEDMLKNLEKYMFEKYENVGIPWNMKKHGRNYQNYYYLQEFFKNIDIEVEK